jgi:hypothetical protein
MHSHTDKPCKHDLKVCTDCGNVYCAKCNKEWFKNGYSFTYQPYVITSGTSVYSAGSDTITPTITWTDPHTHVA